MIDSKRPLTEANSTPIEAEENPGTDANGVGPAGDRPTNAAIRYCRRPIEPEPFNIRREPPAPPVGLTSELELWVGGIIIVVFGGLLIWTLTGSTVLGVGGGTGVAGLYVASRYASNAKNRNEAMRRENEALRREIEQIIRDESVGGSTIPVRAGCTDSELLERIISIVNPFIDALAARGDEGIMPRSRLPYDKGTIANAGVALLRILEKPHLRAFALRALPPDIARWVGEDSFVPLFRTALPNLAYFQADADAADELEIWKREGRLMLVGSLAELHALGQERLDFVSSLRDDVRREFERLAARIQEATKREAHRHASS